MRLQCIGSHPSFLFVLLKRLEGSYACESNSDFKEHICVLKQGRVVWHFCEKWVNLLLEVPTQLLLVEPDSKWSETFLPVLGTIRFKSIRGNGFNWWMLATSILRLARNIPRPRNPTISNLSLSDIRNYLLSFVYISIICYLLSISPWVVRTFSQWNSTSCVFNSLSLWSFFFNLFVSSSLTVFPCLLPPLAPSFASLNSSSLTLCPCLAQQTNAKNNYKYSQQTWTSTWLSQSSSLAKKLQAYFR